MGELAGKAIGRVITPEIEATVARQELEAADLRARIRELEAACRDGQEMLGYMTGSSSDLIERALAGESK